ncbi:Rha family transcriptional regulator [Pseudomonas sp. P7548]|uniref:Rha family transcriptional regulator n=1 Tax=Pseudomonas sp. P7548 TaxID=2726981 RepID=UPI002116B207|nr:Rha family transcriptional regulator [Pseudomonas sp. P7548]
MFNGIKEITMTTVEIAAMTGKRHDNVLRDAHAIVAKVNALKSEECSNNDQSTGAIEATYLDGRKAERPMLVLNKHMVFTLITGYDTGLRYTVVGRKTFQMVPQHLSVHVNREVAV